MLSLKCNSWHKTSYRCIERLNSYSIVFEVHTGISDSIIWTSCVLLNPPLSAANRLD